MSIVSKLILPCFLIFIGGCSDKITPDFQANSLMTLPEDGRSVYIQAFEAASKSIQIEICVLQDPELLKSLKNALLRNPQLQVQIIVDRGKYNAVVSEQENLSANLTNLGTQLHLSNPIFPRSFPKIILIDSRTAIIGSACLDETTFEQYRDYAYVTEDTDILKDLNNLFANDWQYSSPVGALPPNTNPTPPIESPNLLVSPTNSEAKMVAFIRGAQRTLDIGSELLGNTKLEDELIAAQKRGVRVRLITPKIVNGATSDIQTLQDNSIKRLGLGDLEIHVSNNPQSFTMPYMHARIAIADETTAYLGSISLSADSTTRNREVGLILTDPAVVLKLQTQFNIDFQTKTSTP